MVFHPEPFQNNALPTQRQRENHTGVLASDSSHEYIVNRRSMCNGLSFHYVVTFFPSKCNAQILPFETVSSDSFFSDNNVKTKHLGCVWNNLVYLRT